MSVENRDIFNRKKGDASNFAPRVVRLGTVTRGF